MIKLSTGNLLAIPHAKAQRRRGIQKKNEEGKKQEAESLGSFFSLFFLPFLPFAPLRPLRPLRGK
jgi:hypothetical protein